VFGPPLNPDGSYTVQTGDYGTLIAKKIIGEPGRWRELLTVNPQIKSRPDPYDTGFVVYPGDVLTIPAEWLIIVNPLAGK
jgi:nucleoid-associated protein YgaU